jgi:hypothetical protein
MEYDFLVRFGDIDWSNQWFVGIGTAIISGIVLTLLTRLVISPLLTSRKDKKEYRQAVDAANLEVLYALRPSIAENSVPPKTIVQSLISATGRKYGVEVNDLKSIPQVADDLIKEVMDSSFISTKQKIAFCTKIARLKASPQPKAIDIVNPNRLGTRDPYYIYRRKLQRQIMLILTIIFSILSLVASLNDDFRRIFSAPFEPQSAITYLVAAVALPILVVFALVFESRVARLQKRVEAEFEEVVHAVMNSKHRRASAKKRVKK